MGFFTTNRISYLGAGLGVLYGLIARLFFGFGWQGDFFGVMSGAFIFGVPPVLGFITIWYSGPEKKDNFLTWLVLPWGTGFLYLFSALASAWEGLICIFVWLPLVMVLSSIGGLIAGSLRRTIKGGRDRHYCVALVALLPFLIAPFEHFRTVAAEMRTVNTQIRIHASPHVVWNQIKTVLMIRPEEQSWSFTHFLGFPRPLEAKLVGEGAGAVRYATFERGVLFVETISEWNELHRISFSIHADTEHIPPTTFDEHVTIGGKYFDVLRGTYWIEPVDKGDVILHLSSDQRLSTRFNFYSHYWTEYLMADLQNYILKIVKKTV